MNDTNGMQLVKTDRSRDCQLQTNVPVQEIVFIMQNSEEITTSGQRQHAVEFVMPFKVGSMALHQTRELDQSTQEHRESQNATDDIHSENC